MAKKTQVIVTTAHQLTPEQEKLLRSKLAKKIGKNFELVKQVDKGVIGGIKLSVGNKVKDATISGSIAELESQFKKATILSAIKLGQAQKQKIKQALKKKHGELDYHFVVDPDIIGGIKLSIGFNEYDATLKTKLEKLKLHILEKL